MEISYVRLLTRGPQNNEEPFSIAVIYPNKVMLSSIGAYRDLGLDHSSDH